MAISGRAALSALALSFSGLMWAQTAVGDEIVTTSGDRLTGEVLRQDQDTVLLRTTYAGTLSIDRSQVRSLRRGPAPEVATTIESTDIETDSGASGATVQQESGLRSPNEAATPVRAASTQPSPFTPETELSGRINFSLSHEKGNTDKDEIDFDYQVDYLRGWHRLRSFGGLEFDTNGNDKTTDKWSVFNQYSRLFPSRWYGAAWLALEHDRFSDLRLRTIGGPAVGYLAFESEALNLTAEAGPAVLLEDFYGQPDQDSSGAAWFLNYDQLVWQGRLQPYHRQFGYVAMDGEDKLLWQAWTGLRVPLAGGFTGAVELEYDYDSNPAVEAKTTDTTLRLKLGYEW